MTTTYASPVRTVALGKHYGRTVALDGLDLTVEQGQIHGFLGPNGAGKTTTLRILLGLLRPTSGRAEVLGLDPWADAVAAHRRLAYVPGDVTLWPSLTGGEVIDLLARLRGSTDRRRRDALLERFDLDPTKRCRAYSKGNRQKVALVAAFAADVDVLILDEPTTGLDPLMEETFRQVAREGRQEGRTMLLSSHILSEVEQLCDQVTIVRAGRVVEAAPLSLLRAAHQSVLTADLAFPVGTELVDDLAGVTDAVVHGSALSCRADPGALEALLTRLTAVGIRSLTCTPPSLEDLFLAHYEQPERVP